VNIPAVNADTNLCLRDLKVDIIWGGVYRIDETFKRVFVARSVGKHYSEAQLLV
jgi:hypothetical protein